MTMLVGCLTIVNYKIFKGANGRFKETISMDWFLHPTKGWKKGPRTKKYQSVSYVDLHPLTGHSKIWRKY